VRFLLDANLSPRLVVLLSEAGYDAVHVGELDLLSAPDPVIFDRAADDGYVLITADTDFSMLLALKEAALPSVILLRRVSELSPEEHAQLLVCNVPALTADLDRGVIVSLSPARLAIRDLPIR
jgi:predicted nuclease of predicted toxin-antitoxin system